MNFQIDDVLSNSTLGVPNKILMEKICEILEESKDNNDEIKE